MKKMILATALLATVFSGSIVHASLSYEYLCSSTKQEQESSVLRIAIAPNGSTLLAVSSEGEVEESYSLSEVVQFSYEGLSKKRTKLRLQISAEANRTGHSHFRIVAQSKGSGTKLFGTFEVLELRNLSFVVVSRSNLECRLLD